MLQDIRHALRLLLKSPGFTAVAVVMLALGMAVITAVFSAVNVLVTQPLPFKDSERLAVVSERNLAKGTTSAVSFANYADWREQNQVFEEMGAVQERSFNVTSGEGPESLRGARASVAFFAALGFKPVLGRGFLPEEERPGRERVVLISDSLWQRRFGSKPEVLGLELTLDGESYTIVGVVPRIHRSFYAGCDVWTPLLAENGAADRANRSLQVVARLKPGLTFERAQVAISTIARRLEQQYPESNAGWGVAVFSMREMSLADVLPAFLILLTAVGLILLIVCANIANLQLARAAARQKEVAVRMALGASRLRIVWQLLTEGLLLAVTSGGLGLLLVVWIRTALIATVPELAEIGVDARVLVFTVLISLVTGLVFGLAPALSASKPDVNEALKAGARSVAAGSGRRLRNALVVSEMAVALVLLVGAGLLIKSFVQLRKADPGFRTQNLLTMHLSLPQLKYAKAQQRTAFYRQVVERAAVLPGVQSAAVMSALPLTGTNLALSFEIEGRTPRAAGDSLFAAYTIAGPEYFRTLGIPLRRGRHFTQQDREGAPPVLIINERMAQLHWPNEDPIGKRIRLAGSQWSTIVGVASNAKQILVRPPSPEMFVPHAQDPSPNMALAVRTTAQPMSLLAAVRGEIRALDLDLPVSYIQSMEDVISGYFPGAMVVGIACFCGAALFLAALGLYGVISHLVTQRTREIGIRRALGAQRSDVVKLVVRQGLRLAALGAVLGLAGGLALARVLARALFGVKTSDPMVFASVTLVLMAVALAASYIPARRATQVDPIVALHYE
jgi:putative ABC transport system permease protein